MCIQTECSQEQTRPRLADQKPSVKLTYKSLVYAGPMTQKELVEETRLSPPTVRAALARLEDIGRVDQRLHLDARQRLYEADD